MVLDQSLRIAYANPAEQKWLIVPLRKGLKCYEGLFKREEPCDNCPVLQAFQDGQNHTCPLFYSNVFVGWYHLQASPIPEPGGGKPRYVIESVRNVTSQFRREENLQSQNTLISEVLNSLEDGIMTLTEGVELPFINDMFKTFFTSLDTIRPNESMDRVRSIFAPQITDAEEFFKAVEYVRKHRNPYSTVIHLKDGRICRLVGKVVPTGLGLKGESEVWTIRDITKELTEERHAREMEKVVEHFSLPVFRLNQGGKILYVNNSTTQSLKFQQEALLDKYIWELIHPGFREKWPEVIKELQDSGTCHFDGTMIREDGSAFQASFFCDLFEHKPDSLLTLCVQDLTEQVSRIEAEQKTIAMSQFLATMSHEMRTPLNSIIGGLDLLPMDNFTFDQIDYMRNMKGMAHILLGLINDTLDLSRIEAGMLELESKPYNLHSVFDDIVSVFHVTARTKGLEFRSSYSVGTDVLLGDELRVRQLFTNIVSNAVKYTRKGFVELSVRRENRNGMDYISVNVKDTGLGIKEEDKHKLFNRFSQVNRRENRGIEGTGLGLAIVRNILDKMDGFVEVKSEYGKGSEFTVFFPFVEGDAESLCPAAEDRWVQVNGTISALVVDDVTTNLIVAKGYLSRHGILVDGAGGGREAMEMIASKAARGERYDVIFMDHMMPGMDGLEATKILRAWEKEQRREERVPVIALTANAMGTKQLFLDADMDDLITKPINKTALNNILLKWLPPESLDSDDPDAQQEEAS
jgi:PAS domain S-box-containing protein